MKDGISQRDLSLTTPEEIQTALGKQGMMEKYKHTHTF